jgi:2,4-dienoyl-CoA reductase-like NADH-dependent reductase (Old Yellow Enzyme family)
MGAGVKRGGRRLDDTRALMPHLFDTLTLRGTTLRNRIGVSPMCQYSCVDGLATNWHLVHLGSRAVGGAALVMAEATAVEPRGRISPGDLGLWSEAQAAALEPIARFVTDQGAVSGIQLAHAGRKASHAAPWLGGGPLRGDDGWPVIGPSAVPFSETDLVPKEMTAVEIASVVEAFRVATVRAKEAGFGWVELHAAHGYLLHSFYSPLSNRREDVWGGAFENRIRFTLEVLRTMRSAWPEDRPLSVRLSCSDWVDGGWTIEDTVSLARRLKADGADLVDCSSGALVPYAKIPVGAGYQVPFAEAVRRGAGIPTAAVGMITDPMQADEIVRNGRADMVLLAREELRNPYWPIRAAQALSQTERLQTPIQYGRAFTGPAALTPPGAPPAGGRRPS